MKRGTILIASDSYKGCMSSREVNAAMAEGVRCGLRRRNCGDVVQILALEMSDGGDGMLDAFLSAVDGERVIVRSHDALMRSVDANYGLWGDTAIVEVAQAVGLARIEPSLRNPLRATSYGVGEILVDAYLRGVRRFIVGLGGSAMSDCGMGMLRAIGDRWRDLRNNCSFLLASDVTNPLLGACGAAHVFAPQKGANDAMVEYLEGLAVWFADVCKRSFGYDCSSWPGAGAAGGLGYAFMQFFGAHQQSGADLLLDLLHFDALLGDACLVITGEGHSDQQTLMGKLPMCVLRHAHKASVPVWLVSGKVDDISAMMAVGFARAVSATPCHVPLAEAMISDVARQNVEKATSVLFAEEFA